jgi:branched-chain amino acid aminotransferase
VRALAFARGHGCSEAVFANLQGNLCEGTGTNVFYVVDGELRTPTLTSGCLAGVTRGLILDWYGATEVDEPIEAVTEEASEIFLSSTTRDVQAIHGWNDRDLEAPGPVTTEVRKAWHERETELLA